MNTLKLDAPPLMAGDGHTFARGAINRLHEDRALYERLYDELHRTHPLRYDRLFYEEMHEHDGEQGIQRWLLGDAELDAFRSLLPYEDQHARDAAFLQLLHYKDPQAMGHILPSMKHALDARTTFVIFQETVQQVQLDFPAWRREREYLDHALQPAWHETWAAFVDLALYDVATIVYGYERSRLELLLHGRAFAALDIYYGLRLTDQDFRPLLQRWAAAVLRERELQESRMHSIMSAAQRTM